MDIRQRKLEVAEARAEDYKQKLEQLDSAVTLLMREFESAVVVGCDGLVLIPVDKYNRIVRILNSTIKQ